MIERDSRRSDLVARVKTDLCVSCGICAGSCSPMGVGPPGRTGRDQVAAVRDFLGRPERQKGEIVAICCEHGAWEFADDLAAAGSVPYAVDCGGNLHTSVIEFLLRDGAGGVIVLACPPRDCWHREGARWLEERVYRAREAELQPRVDRARVRIISAGSRERVEAVAALRAFAAEVALLSPASGRASDILEDKCEPARAGGRS